MAVESLTLTGVEQVNRSLGATSLGGSTLTGLSTTTIVTSCVDGRDGLRCRRFRQYWRSAGVTISSDRLVRALSTIVSTHYLLPGCVG